MKKTTLYICAVLSLVLLMVNPVTSFGLTRKGNFEFDAATGTLTRWNGWQAKAVVPASIKGVTVKHIAPFAFANRRNLKTIILPKNVKTIGMMAFMDCKKLTKIIIPSGVRYIGNYAFLNCASLQQITLPSKVEIIGRGAFYNCTELKSIKIPVKVKVISSMMFHNCTSLAKVDLPRNVKVIRNSAFRRCSSLKTIDLPDSLISIEPAAFKFCSSLQKVIVPKKIIHLRNSIFRGCASLKSVTLPKGLEIIGGAAFRNCTDLKSILIPRKVEVVGAGAFSGCTSLERAVFRGDAPRTSYETFLNVSRRFEIHFPNYASRWATPYWKARRAVPYRMVTFVNGTTSTLRTVDYGDTTTAPAVSKAGCTLAGWYTEKTGSDGQKFDSTKIVKARVTYYARWRIFNRYLSMGVYSQGCKSNVCSKSLYW